MENIYVYVKAKTVWTFKNEIFEKYLLADACLRPNSYLRTYLCTKFQADPSSGSSCVMLNQSVIKRYFIHK